jgi:hypothetical protein
VNPNTMRILALIGAAVALSTFAACTPQAPAASAPPTPVNSAAATAQRVWEVRRPAAYAYDLTIACMCIHRGEYAVEVRDRHITSVRDRATGAPSPESRVEWIVTVDRLFELMRQASQAGTPVRATYHHGMGYPAEVEIGMLADDSGTLYTIQNLRAL